MAVPKTADLPLVDSPTPGRILLWPPGPAPRAAFLARPRRDDADRGADGQAVEPSRGLRGEIATTERARKRVEYDVYYIENWSPLLDIRIMIETVLKLIWDKNAY